MFGAPNTGGTGLNSTVEGSGGEVPQASSGSASIFGSGAANSNSIFQFGADGSSSAGGGSSSGSIFGAANSGGKKFTKK